MIWMWLLYDKVAQNNYWKTEADAKSGVMGVYAQLKDYGAYGYMPLFDTYSDIGHGPGGPVEQGTYNGAYDFLVQNWQDTYDGVQRANTVIKNVSSMSIDDQVKNNVLGEAHFLRALYYFHLADFFGGVPIYDESWEVSESFNEMLLPRNSREEVWNFIIKTDFCNCKPSSQMGGIRLWKGDKGSGLCITWKGASVYKELV